MKIIRPTSVASVQGTEGAVVVLGNFDGVHRGHQQVLAAATTLARRLSLAGGYSVPVAALSFYPHPQKVLRGASPALLQRYRDRFSALSAQGCERMVMVRFSRTMAEQPAREFLERFLPRARGIVLGADARVGRGREGDAAFIAAWAQGRGIPCEIVPLTQSHQVAPYGGKIGSGVIRELLCRGEVTQVAELLGRPFSISGRVTRGDQRGRTLGFPTANLRVTSGAILPRRGVYASVVIWRGVRYPAVTNIGIRPTFGGASPVAETHLFDFSQDLYGERLEVELGKFLREERRFASRDDLINQIMLDCAQAKGGT